MNRRIALVLMVGVGVGALSTGCNPAREPYGDVRGTAKCLREAGYSVTTNANDFVASTASRGALRASRNFNLLIIAFGEDASEAASLRRAYQRFMEKRRARHLKDISEIEKNAFLLWTTTPTDEQLRGVLACLK
jgi:hypothetical protein